MEREVQWAKAGVKQARYHPFAHMAGRAHRREQIKQLGHHLGIAERLDIDQRIANGKNSNLGPKHEQQIDNCEYHYPILWHSLTDPYVDRPRI